PAEEAKTEVDARPIARVRTEQHRQVIGGEAEKVSAEAGPGFLASHLGTAGKKVEERLAAIGQVPEEPRRVAQRPSPGERGKGRYGSPAVEEQKKHADGGEGNDGEDVAPEGEAEEKSGDERDADSSRGHGLGPAHAENERPGTESQHLHGVPVVAEAVAGHEGRSKRGVKPRGPDHR